jgi:hypothetical protein
MSYALLTAAHGLGALLLGVALVGSWLAGERARHAKTAGAVARAAARQGALARRLLLPGVLLLGASGAWLVASHYGGWNFVRVPWLAGMIALFVFQSVWANTVGRAYAIRLGRLLAGTREADPLSPELRRALAEPVATFGHHLELPLFAVIVALGVLRPMQWSLFATGCAVAAGIALAATAYGGGARRPASSFSSASVDAEGGAWSVAPSTSRQRR